MPALDNTVEKTNLWLNELQSSIGTSDRHLAYVALRGVLHTVRDRIPPDEVAQLSAQLPMLIRGILFEGWDPSRTPRRYRHKKDFLEQVAREAPALAENSLELTVSSVLNLIGKEISSGEAEQVRALLPAEVRELWPRSGL